MRKEYIRIFSITVINLIIIGIFFGILGSMGIREKIYTDPTLAVFVGGGISIFIIVVTLLFYKFVDKKPLAALGFSLRKKDSFFAMGMSAVVVLCYWLFIKALEKAGLLTIEYAPDYLSSHHDLLILPFLFGWLLAALQEEICSYSEKNLIHSSYLIKNRMEICGIS